MLITDDNCFYFVDGKKASSLEELRNLLGSMEDAEFVFHVNAGKNDFANWTEGVFQEKELADEMRRALEKPRMIELLDEFFERKKHPSQEKDDLPVFGVKEASGWDEVDTEAIKEQDKPVPDAEWKAIEVPKIDSLTDQDEKDEGRELPDDGDDSLKRIVFDSRRVIKEEEARLSHKAHPALPEPKFLVKEFIYGFIIGLIFGLIMLGILLNLRP